MNPTKLREFGTKYAAAWCSQNAASAAAFYEEKGFLQINAGPAFRWSGRYHGRSEVVYDRVPPTRLRRR
jgi:hypothetical protein